MTPSHIKLSNVAGAAANSTATIDYPLTWRYLDTVLKIVNGGTARATCELLVKEIRMKVNGRVQRARQAYQINARNLANSEAVANPTGVAAAVASPGSLVAWTYTSAGVLTGYLGADGYFKGLTGADQDLAANGYMKLPILFAEPFRTGGDVGGFPTFNEKGQPVIGSFQFEIDLVNAATASAVTATAQVDSVPIEYAYGPGIKAASPILTKWNTLTIANPGTASETSVNNLPKDPNQAYQAMILWSDAARWGGTGAGGVSRVKVRVRNDNKVDDWAKEDLDEANVRAGMCRHAINSSRLDIDFDRADRLNNALRTDGVSELVVSPTWISGTAGVAHLAYDCYGPLW